MFIVSLQRKTEKTIMYTLTPSIIALQRGMFYINDDLPALGFHAEMIAYTTQAELMQFGVMLDERAFSHLSLMTGEDIIRYHDEVIAYLTYIKGDGEYRPLYDGFPQQVMEMSESELFFNAICHYWSNGEWVPNAYTKSKPTVFEHPTYKILSPCSEAKFNRIFTDILSVNQSITPMDKEVLTWFRANRPAGWVMAYLPKEIPFKENLCFVLELFDFEVVPFTYTDILRTAAYMSDGDVSLATNTCFHLTNKQRARIMQMLEFKTRGNHREGQEFLDSLEDLKKHRNKWLALFNHIHADSKHFRKPYYANAQRVVELLRFHADNIHTWNAKVENLSLLSGRLELLMQRPGEFARRLNSLLSACCTPIGWSERIVYRILANFRLVSEKISNKVLFELYRYFEDRREDQKQRTVFIKGARKPVKLEPLKALPGSLVTEVQNIILSTIRCKLQSWPKLGKVIIDEKLKNIPLPTNMRSISETDTPVVRGTRMPINVDYTKTVRFYVHWEDERGTEDLDLSATLLGMGDKTLISWNTNYKLVEYYNYGNRLDEEFVACHSGDVRHRKGDCAEYIDIDIKAARRRGTRYVIIDVRNFEGRSMKSLNPAFGYMEREHPEANSTWVPNTVAASWRLQSEAKACIAVMIDLETMEYIPLDIDSNSIAATGDTESLLTAMWMYMEPPKLSVHDLVMWHAEARGAEVVEQAEEGEEVTYFRFEDFAGSYIETLKLMADTPPEVKTE